MLPGLPHYSGSSVGVRETTSLCAFPPAWILLVPTLSTSHCGAKICQMSNEWHDEMFMDLFNFFKLQVDNAVMLNQMALDVTRTSRMLLLFFAAI